MAATTGLQKKHKQTSQPDRHGKHRVFVYGTLRLGQPNHQLLAKARWVQSAKTKPIFDLLNLGPFPALIAHGQTQVAGDIYEVNQVTLAALDRLEGHPDFYQRRTIALDSGESVWAYLMPRDQRLRYPIIQSGDWWDVCFDTAITQIQIQADGRVFEGTPIDMVRAMQSRTLRDPNEPLKDYIDWATQQAQHASGRPLVVSGHTIERQAQNFIRDLLETGLAV